MEHNKNNHLMKPTYTTHANTTHTNRELCRSQNYHFLAGLLPALMLLLAPSPTLRAQIAIPTINETRLLGVISELTGLGTLFSGTTRLVGDSDGDGVDDAVDACPGTVMAERLPPHWKKNRFAANAAGQFVDANGAPSGISVVDTCGCSGSQIIAADGLSRGHSEYGISLSALQAWIAGLPFQVKATDPASGARLSAVPLHMTVALSHAILASSLEASDFMVDGLP